MSRNKYVHKTINGVKKRIHRHIVEEYIGRPLKDNEHVYHINGDSSDNSLDNLQIIVKNIKENYGKYKPSDSKDEHTHLV